MSNWTDERHEQVRRRLDATDGALRCGWDDGLDDPMQEVVANAHADLMDALDEIERLRAEAPASDPGVEFAEWVMEFVPNDRQDEAWREFTRSKVRVCLGDHKTESQLREELHETESQLQEATERMRSTLNRLIHTEADA